MNHERFEELKDAYVLGALPAEERREFEGYLAARPERQAEIDELGAVASLLALSPEEQEPSPELRRRVMSVVEAEALRTALRPWLAGIREYPGVRNLAFGVAILLMIGLLVWNILLQGELRDLEAKVQNLQAPREGQLVAMKGTGAAQRVHAEVMIFKDRRAVLMAEDMPSVPEDKTFQIWVIQDDVPKPGGLFEPQKEPVVIVIKKRLYGADAVAVSVEPEGGSPRPTSDPMLMAEL